VLFICSVFKQSSQSFEGGRVTLPGDPAPEPLASHDQLPSSPVLESQTTTLQTLCSFCYHGSCFIVDRGYTLGSTLMPWPEAPPPLIPCLIQSSCCMRDTSSHKNMKSVSVCAEGLSPFRTVQHDHTLDHTSSKTLPSSKRSIQR